MSHTPKKISFSETQVKLIFDHLDHLSKMATQHQNELGRLRAENTRLLEYLIKIVEAHRGEFTNHRETVRKKSYIVRRERSKTANKKARQQLSEEIRALMMEMLYPDREPDSLRDCRAVQKDFLRDKYANTPNR